MRHDIRLIGFGFGLRPVEMRDAAEIVALRTDPRNQRFINETSSSIADQEAWLQRYFERAGDWYFVIHHLASGITEGVVGIYDYDSAANAAEWGRWVLRHGSIAAIESALLVYRAAFEAVRLDAVYCRTVADNVQVVSFHDSSGVPRANLLEGSAVIRGVAYDQVEHRIDRARFAQMEPRLGQLARRTAARLDGRPT